MRAALGEMAEQVDSLLDDAQRDRLNDAVEQMRPFAPPPRGPPPRGGGPPPAGRGGPGPGTTATRRTSTLTDTRPNSTLARNQAERPPIVRPWRAKGHGRVEGRAVKLQLLCPRTPGTIEFI